MFDRKRRDYKRHLHELEVQQGIAYRPLIWSTWGRMHPGTLQALTNLAMQATRRRGLRDHRLLLRHVRAAIGMQLMRRVVRMLHSCMPHLEDAEAQLLLGSSEHASSHPESRNLTILIGEADCQCP